MAISVTQQPQAYTPGYSPQFFSALSTNIAQPNFLYTVKCTDIISGDTQTYQIPQRPDGYMVFDAMPFAESRLTHYCPINQYGWKLADGVRKIRVNIGETYGSTPVYASGSNIDYIVWNAISDFKDFPSFDKDSFVYDSDTDNNVYLTGQMEDVTFNERSNLLYALTSKPNDIYSINIKGYNSAGTLIKDSTIPNPYVADSNYLLKYLCIDIGHKGLVNIDASGVLGDYPILSDQVCRYDVFDIYDDGSDFVLTKIKAFTVECEPRYDVYTLHYLRKNGSFASLNFSKRSDKTITTQKDYYKKLVQTFSSGQYTYSPSSSVERVLSSESQESLKLNTDWLTPEQIEYHADIADSPIIYLDYGYSDYLQLKVITNSYKLNKRYNERIFSIQMDFEYSHQNYRQRC